ncbi:haloacid dehalogenase family hydrolase [Streptococcus dysgalactiae]|nr:haloacid dehalogenase family hydrolase [Streptococcus dysgalactiae]
MQNLKENLLQLQLEGVSIQQSGSYYLEITHQEAVKSRGIDYIMTALKLPKEATVAFGDGHNDLPMFAKVGTSIAMANAHLDVLRQATFVTTTNDKDGVAHGIWKYVKEPMTSIRDIAKLAGVAPSTVSRYLNQSDYVSKETSQIIATVIQQLDYSPNMTARQLSTGKNQSYRRYHSPH